MLVRRKNAGTTKNLSCISSTNKISLNSDSSLLLTHRKSWIRNKHNELFKILPKAYATPIFKKLENTRNCFSSVHRAASTIPWSSQNAIDIHAISSRFRNTNYDWTNKSIMNCSSRNSNSFRKALNKSTSSFMSNTLTKEKKTKMNYGWQDYKTNKTQLQWSNPLNPYHKILYKSTGNEARLASKKKDLKSKIWFLLKKHTVMPNKVLWKNKENFHPEAETERRKQIALKNLVKRQKSKGIVIKKKNIFTPVHPELFSKSKISFRYEDLYKSPEELWWNYFTKEEIYLMMMSPNYFLWTRPPFEGEIINMYKSLADIINAEDSNKNGIKPKDEWFFNVTKKKDQNQLRKIRDNFEKTNIELKGMFKKKKQRAKSQPTKKQVQTPKKNNKYETDYDDEDDNFLFSDDVYEKVFEKIEARKQMTLFKKQDNIRFKKDKFEYLKNKHWSHKLKGEEEYYQARIAADKVEKIYLNQRKK